MATKTAPTGFGRPIWSAIKGGNQVHGVGLVPVVSVIDLPDATTGAWAADTNVVSFPLFTAPAKTASGGSWKLESIQIECENAIQANNHADNGVRVWFATGRGVIATVVTTGAYAFKKVTPTFLETDVTGTAVLLPKDTTTPVTVNGPDSATPAEVFLEGGDCFVITFQRAGTGHDISGDGPITVTSFWRHSPPGR
jgi:hypothetical protein